MRGFGWVIFLFALSTGAQAASLPTPLEPAATGKLQCYAPDISRKTCQSLAAYEARTDGSILNPATVLVSKAPIVVMNTATLVSVKGSSVCGTITADDVAQAHFKLAGQDATTNQTDQLRKIMIGAQKALFGHQICTAYSPEGGMLKAEVSIDGARQPSMDQPVIWVSPSDGFTVNP